MYTVFIVIHVVVCVLLVASILLQSGRSAGFQGIFGSSGEVIFSTPSGSSFLRKATIALGVVFGITSITLTVFTRSRMYRSVVLEQAVQAASQQPAPAAPAQQPPAGAPPAQPQNPPAPAK